LINECPSVPWFGGLAGGASLTQDSSTSSGRRLFTTVKEQYVNDISVGLVPKKKIKSFGQWFGSVGSKFQWFGRFQLNPVFSTW